MSRLAAAVLLLAGLLTAPAHAQAAEPIPEGAAVDGFDGPPLGPGWTVPARDDSRWSLTEQPGALRVHALPGDTYQDTNTARNLFLMDIPAGDFEVVAAVRAPVTLDFQSAGILAWQDWDNHVRTGLAHVGSEGGQVIETDTEIGGAFTAAFAPRPGSFAEVVKLSRTGAEFVSSTWDGTAWAEASRVTAGLDVRQVGLFALAAQDGTSFAADFDYFAVKAAPGQPVVPEGMFTLRHQGEERYLSADAADTVHASAKPPMTGLPLTAETDGRLKDAATGKYLEISRDRVRLGTTGSVFRLTDAGGGKVTVSSGDRHLAVSRGRLVTAAEGGRFRVEGYTTGELTVDTAAKGTKVGPHLYGVFYEDINHGADGGLYAELVQNRSFEFDPADEPSYHGLTAWSAVERGGTAAATVSGDRPLNPDNRNYLRLEVTGGPAGVQNAGFNSGLPLKRGERYDLSFWARRDTPGTVTVSVESGSATYGKTTVKVRAGGWTKYRATFRATGTTDAGRLVLLAPEGRTDLDMVSLFPRGTFKNRPNGMRKDLAELIAELKPRFLRFPGGCVTNVGTYDPYRENLDRRRIYQWKETIGPVEERPTNFNFWGYNQSYGIGFYEYFQFAEDLGAEPLPVLSVGVNGCGQDRPLTDEAKLDRWVQDTLDLIEFANGPVTSTWGKKRAELGHPKPFGMKYLGLGNEEIYPEFFDNYPRFADAVRAKYPDIKIISNSGTTSQGAWFDRMWEFARDQKADLVDEHYYNNPDWFLTSNRRYDSYDREGPKVFVGEYASRGNTFFNALSEASYLTGIERNADVVELAAYAPLLANVDYVDWAPDLIWFDNDEAYGSPSYHVQKLFSRNAGDTVLPSTFEGTTRPVEDISGAVGLASWNTSVRYDDVKVTAADGTVLLEDDFADGAARWRPGTVGLGRARVGRTATVTSLTGDPADVNTLAEPDRIAPVEHRVPGFSRSFTYDFPAHSVTFIRLSGGR